MAVSEEKVSSDLENSFNKEKVNEVEQDKENNEVKTDAMLDEIAAKVDALDFNKFEEEETEVDADDLHTKCMETVKKQGETINTLVQQLRVMFDEYQAVDQEREYYEELNDALIRCLEISEGKIRLESESERENAGDDEEETDEGEHIANLVERQPGRISICEGSEKEKDRVDSTSQTETENAANEINGIKNESRISDKEAKENDDDDESTSSETDVLHQAELIRLNRILLREIFELRHQIDVMKENIRDYLHTDTEEGSEYDTATDDDPDHICEHCAPPATRHDVTAVSDKDVKEEDESYEILENENDEIINDEPDTE